MKSAFNRRRVLNLPMTDDQQIADYVFTREHMHFARQDLERSERLSLAVTLIWLVVAVLAMVLIFVLIPS